MEAASQCHIVTSLVYMHALDTGFAEMRVNSRGMGGECQVTDVRIVNGFYKAPAGVFNPLLYDPNGRCHTLFAPAIDELVDGQHVYQHAWLLVNLKTPA